MTRPGSLMTSRSTLETDIKAAMDTTEHSLQRVAHIVSILESNSTRECLFVFFTVAAIIGPLMNWKIIQSLGSSKKYSARVDHFSLLEIWAGVANFPVILSQIWTMVSWTNQDVSEDNPQYLVWWDVPPIGLEFIARFSIVAKGLSSTMIATIRCALIFSHLTNLQLRWITACNWKIIGILSASLAISTLTTDVGFNRFVGLPFYHALTRRHTYQGFAKSVEVYDRLALTFLAMLNLIKFVAYTAIFRYLFRHDKLMEKSLIRDRHCFLKRHKKNVSNAWVHFLCWISDSSCSVVFIVSMSFFGHKSPSDMVVLYMYCLPVMNFIWTPLILTYI